MTHATDTLPDDPQALKSLVAAQRAEIEQLNRLITKLRHVQFWQHSEQVQIEQLQLVLQALKINQAKAIAPPGETRSRHASRRKPLLEHLPREVHSHAPNAQCPCCGSQRRHLGEDASEMLEYISARFKVMRHMRLKVEDHDFNVEPIQVAQDRGFAKRFLHSRTAVAELVMHQTPPQHGTHRIHRRNTIAFRIIRLDQSNQTLPGHELIHVVQEAFAMGLPACSHFVLQRCEKLRIGASRSTRSMQRRPATKE